MRGALRPAGTGPPECGWITARCPQDFHFYDFYDAL